MMIPGAAEITLYGSVGGSLVINKLGVRVIGTPTFGQALANTVGSAIKSAWTTNMGPLCSSGAGLLRVGIRDLRTDNNPEYRDTGASVTGSGTGDNMPAGVALCVTLRTAGSGKSFRGRTYLSGFNENQNTATGETLAAAATGALSFMAAVQNGIRTPIGELAVLTRPAEEKIITETTKHNDGTTTTRTLSHVKPKSGATHDVTAFESRTSKWEHQRRRDNGRGQVITLLDPVARLDATTGETTRRQDAASTSAARPK